MAVAVSQRVSLVSVWIYLQVPLTLDEKCHEFRTDGLLTSVVTWNRLSQDGEHLKRPQRVRWVVQ